MTSVRLVLIGGGEHARVVAEAAGSNPEAFEILGFVDPNECPETEERLGIRRLGSEASLAKCDSAHGILGVGATGPTTRRAEIVERVSPMVNGWATIRHRNATVSPSATIEEGTVLMAGTVINSGARIGKHCVINSGAVVEHDVYIADHVIVGPQATIGGGTRIGDGCFIGLGASIRDHLCIGSLTLVGMGAVVVTDAGSNKILLGVPAVERDRRE